VFKPAATQRDVYAKLAPSIEDCFSGFNTTIFAYGQTGTGKTHTVLGLDLWEMAESNNNANSNYGAGAGGSSSSSRPTSPIFDPAELQAKVGTCRQWWF
jgi:hypothetical protein